MFKDGKVWIAKSEKEIYLLPRMANRHGLIAGATGTGKTITMKVIAESFSDMGVPVFFSDVKGDLTGMTLPGADTEDMQKRIQRFGIENWEYKSYPVRFWDIFGEKGTPVRVTVSQMGPMLLSRLLGLTDVQSGVLNIVFKVADEHGLLLIDLKDLRAMLQYVGDNRAEFTLQYGNVSTASVGAIQRALLSFEDEGGNIVFGEPDLDIEDWIKVDGSGRGYMNILASSRLINSPTVYATFLLWMLSELFEKLPEVGDLDKPKMIFFFDEAHLLFDDAPKALVQKIVQIVKLVRSKGIGVYFVTQSPSDIPDEVLAQLSNRVQHGLRAYTPAEQKAVRAAANAFRVNPAFNTEQAMMALGTGEALVSFLDEKGVPSIVENAKILPPQSLMGAADNEIVQNLIKNDELDAIYRGAIDRESAYEVIQAANAALKAQKEAEEAAQAGEGNGSGSGENANGTPDGSNSSGADAGSGEGGSAGAGGSGSGSGKTGSGKTASGKTGKTGTTGKTASKKKNSTAGKTAKKAVTSAVNSVANSVGTNVINSVTSGSTTSLSTIGKRAATSALNSVFRGSAGSILRGLFGNKK